MAKRSKAAGNKRQRERDKRRKKENKEARRKERLESKGDEGEESALDTEGAILAASRFASAGLSRSAMRVRPQSSTLSSMSTPMAVFVRRCFTQAIEAAAVPQKSSRTLRHLRSLNSRQTWSMKSDSASGSCTESS